MVEPKQRRSPSNYLVAFNLNCKDIDILNFAAKNIKVKVYRTNDKDILAKIPAFCLIIDLTGLDEDTVKQILSNLSGHKTIESMIVINSTPKQFTEPNLPKCTFIENIRDDQKNFKLNLLNMKTSVHKKENTLREHDYDTRIYRILTILKLLKARGNIDISELTLEFGVTVRTLQRDIKILRQIGEEIKYDKKKKVYYLYRGRSVLLD